jgi:hypothetical protein
MPRRVVWYEKGDRIYIPRQQYGCFSFFLDVIMTLLTGGLWLIWIFVREMRKR